MAATFNFRSRTTSGNVRGDTVILSILDNVGIAVGIAAPSLAVQKLFPLPVSAGRHLEFWWSTIVYQRRSTSDSVPSVKSKSGVVENVGSSRWNYVCMLLETEVTSTNRKSSIFPRRVPLVFQVAPGNGKSYRHAENGRNIRNWTL